MTKYNAIDNQTKKDILFICNQPPFLKKNGKINYTKIAKKMKEFYKINVSHQTIRRLILKENKPLIDINSKIDKIKDLKKNPNFKNKSGKIVLSRIYKETRTPYHLIKLALSE